MITGPMKSKRKSTKDSVFKEGDEVAFRVNPLGIGFVFGVATVIKSETRVTSLHVTCVQKTPFIKEGQGLILANTMLLPLTALSSCDSLAIIDT